MWPMELPIFAQVEHKALKTRNPNIEIRNKFKIRSTKSKMPGRGTQSRSGGFEHLIFEFVSDFDIRISDFLEQFHDRFTLSKDRNRPTGAVVVVVVHIDAETAIDRG